MRAKREYNVTMEDKDLHNIIDGQVAEDTKKRVKARIKASAKKSKKNSRIAAIDQKIRIALSGLVATGAIVAGLLAQEYMDHYCKDYLNNSKYQTQIVSELGAEMQSMDVYHNYFDGYKIENLVRLKPNDTGKIYVNVDDSVSPDSENSIKQALDEMNDLFAMVNDRYNFVTCTEKEYTNHIENNDTTIQFKYANLSRGVNTNIGLSGLKVAKLKDIDKKGGYILGSTIYLDEDFFESISHNDKLFAIKHELLRSMGFSSEEYEETSMMNYRLVGLSTKISPNDLKMLYIAYGDKHINKNDGSFDSKAFEEVKQKIHEYEVSYYDYLMSQIAKNIELNAQDISAKDVENTVVEKDDAFISFADGKFSYNLGDYTKEGEYIVGSNYIILPDITIDGCGDFLILLKQDNQVKCYNLNILQWRMTTHFEVNIPFGGQATSSEEKYCTPNIELK